MPKPTDPLVYEYMNKQQNLSSVTLSDIQLKVFKLAWGDQPDFDKPPLMTKQEIAKQVGITEFYTQWLLQDYAMRGENTLRQLYLHYLKSPDSINGNVWSEKENKIWFHMMRQGKSHDEISEAIGTKNSHQSLSHEKRMKTLWKRQGTQSTYCQFGLDQEFIDLINQRKLRVGIKDYKFINRPNCWTEEEHKQYEVLFNQGLNDEQICKQIGSKSFRQCRERRKETMWYLEQYEAQMLESTKDRADSSDKTGSTKPEQYEMISPSYQRKMQSQKCWTNYEHSIFALLLKEGKDFESIAAAMKTKSEAQVARRANAILINFKTINENGNYYVDAEMVEKVKELKKYKSYYKFINKRDCSSSNATAVCKELLEMKKVPIELEEKEPQVIELFKITRYSREQSRKHIDLPEPSKLQQPSLESKQWVRYILQEKADEEIDTIMGKRPGWAKHNRNRIMKRMFVWEDE